MVICNICKSTLKLLYQREGKGCMEQLYAAMDELLQTESELNALKAVMSVMREGCRARESQEMEDVLCVFEIYLSCVAEHMRNSIHILDQFLAERKKG